MARMIGHDNARRVYRLEGGGHDTSHLAALAAALDEELPAAVALRHQSTPGPGCPATRPPPATSCSPRCPAGTGSPRSPAPEPWSGSAAAAPPSPSAANSTPWRCTRRRGVPWASRAPRRHACLRPRRTSGRARRPRAGRRPDRRPGPAARRPAAPRGDLSFRRPGHRRGRRSSTGSSAGRSIGAHVQPLLPAGTVACTPGGVNASADEFTVTVRGRGGHAAYPHLTRDPVVALAHIVVALQSLVSRGTDPMSSVVLSVSHPRRRVPRRMSSPAPPRRAAHCARCGQPTARCCITGWRRPPSWWPRPTAAPRRSRSPAESPCSTTTRR